MWRVNFDHTDPKPQDVLDIRHDVGGVAWVQASTRDQPLGIILRIVRDESIDGGRQADHVGRHVVDQRSPIDSITVEIFQKRPGRAAVLSDLIKVSAFALDQCERFRLEHLDGLDVNVAVSNQSFRLRKAKS
jgi:hypothetical protein